jgi:hypothetical protein
LARPLAASIRSSSEVEVRASFLPQHFKVFPAARNDSALVADESKLVVSQQGRFRQVKEQQIGDLLDDFEGIGDTAGPEGIPERVYFTADFAGEHGGAKTSEANGGCKAGS